MTSGNRIEANGTFGQINGTAELSDNNMVALV
jgi:hypothetical protein